MPILARPDNICVASSQTRDSISTRLWKMIAVSRQRHALRRLDDHLLADIGVSDVQAIREANRPAWDVPVTWRK